MRRSGILKYLAIAVFFIMGMMVTGTTDILGANAVGIPPTQGYVVFTRETWGCLAEQKIVGEVSAALVQRDGNTVRIEESKGHEDVQNRSELYAYFPAREVNGLEGYYILRAHVQHPDPKIIGEWTVDQARLMHVSSEWSVELFSKTTGTPQIALLYGRHVGLSNGYLACPEAGQFEPRAKSFIRAYRIESLLTVTSEPTDGGWTRTIVPMNTRLLQEAQEIDRCEELLERLEKRFLYAGNFPLVWEKARVTKQEVEDIVSGLEKETARQYKVSVEIQEKTRKTELGRDKRLFVPKIRQKIALKDPKGVLTAGEVWIGITPSSHPVKKRVPHPPGAQ
jgi:hypothetical protein